MSRLSLTQPNTSWWTENWWYTSLCHFVIFVSCPLSDLSIFPSILLPRIINLGSSVGVREHTSPSYEKVKLFLSTPWGSSENRRIVPLIHSFGFRYTWVINFKIRPLDPQERTRCPLKSEGVWAPDEVWTYWRRENSSSPSRIRTQDRPARTLIAILTSRLLTLVYKIIGLVI
jgi:hypothetical protein